jgi:3-phenylpropionate/cinnamic acid dioxygenase small subunit
MNNLMTNAEAMEFLYREARYLDQRMWNDWLSLYHDDCEYWVPSWKNEDEMTSDPSSEISFIYYSTRAGLEERVLRVQSGKSVTTNPIARTAHAVTNILVLDEASNKDSRGEDTTDIFSTFTVNIFHPRVNKQVSLFGHYEHRLTRKDGNWRIARKKIAILNDYVPTLLDFYLI